MAGVINYSLKVELDFFEQHRQEWCKHHAGKIAVIHGTTIHGFYDNYENALQAGYSQYGVVPLLLKEVVLQDQTESIL